MSQFSLFRSHSNFMPVEGNRAVHQSRGPGLIGDCSDYQYCNFTTDDGAVHFVCKNSLSQIVRTK